MSIIYVCGLNENIVKYYKDVSIRTGSKKSDKKNAWTDLIKVSRELKDSKCTSFYVAHNHLNEYPFPSSDDVKFTENFKNIACKYDVNLVQHWVVSKFNGKPMLWNIIEDK